MFQKLVALFKAKYLKFKTWALKYWAVADSFLVKIFNVIHKLVDVIIAYIENTIKELAAEGGIFKVILYILGIVVAYEIVIKGTSKFLEVVKDLIHALNINGLEVTIIICAFLAYKIITKIFKK